MKQNGFFAEVIKTTKIKVDESSHELPPHNGAYPEFKVADYFCPEEWSNDAVFIPVKEGDPLWFDFRGNEDECAILCAVQRWNPVADAPANLDDGLSKDPKQNYLRMPEQQWLDGYMKDGKVYQFVVTKAGIGLAVNEFVLPKHMQDSHAIGFAFFGPKNPKPKPTYRTRDPYNAVNALNHLVKSKLTYGAAQWNSTSGGMRGLTSGGSDNVFGLSGSDSFNCIDSLDSLDSLSGIPADDCMMGAGASDTQFIGAVFSETDSLEANTVEKMIATKGLQDVEQVDIVDILAEQEASLNELDKASMGAGGRIIQRIETDENTTDYYHEKRSALLTIYFALPEMYDAIMKKGKRQDASKKDKYKTSGHIGGVAVPLIGND